MAFSYHAVRQMNIMVFFVTFFIFQFFFPSCLVFRKKKSKTFASTFTILKKSFLKTGIISLKDGQTPF